MSEKPKPFPKLDELEREDASTTEETEARLEELTAYYYDVENWREEFAAWLQELSNEAEKYPLSDSYMMGRRDLLRKVLEAIEHGF